MKLTFPYKQDCRSGVQFLGTGVRLDETVLNLAEFILHCIAYNNNSDNNREIFQRKSHQKGSRASLIIFELSIGPLYIDHA